MHEFLEAPTYGEKYTNNKSQSRHLILQILLNGVISYLIASQELSLLPRLTGLSSKAIAHGWIETVFSHYFVNTLISDNTPDFERTTFKGSRVQTWACFYDPGLQAGRMNRKPT